MSDNGESSREPQVATSEGGEAAAQAPATTTSTRQGSGRKVQRRALPRTTRDTSWASGSGIGPGVDSATGDPPDAHGAAAAGVATPGSDLPHRGQLEGAFGLDLSSIVAHTGPEAQKTSQAMGANAYATGHHVILPQNAGVGLVAHEVTHVLQQEKGVHLSGGLDGGASDPLEQEANAVGAAVERGESVAGRFSAPSGSGGSVGGAIQRDTTTVNSVAQSGAKKDDPKVSEADKAEAIRRFRVDSAIAGMKLLSTRWQTAIPLVYGKDVDVNAPIDPQKVPVPAFRQNVYNLLVVERTDASPAQAALEAPGRDDYKNAFVAAQQDLDQDTPYLGQIKESIDSIVKGGQMNRNRTRLIAHHAMLRPAGKRAMAQVPSLGAQALADYLAGPASAHGKLEDEHLGAIDQTTHLASVTATENAQGAIYRPLACRQLYDMLHDGAPKLEATTQSAPGGDKKPEVSPEVQQKVDALRLAIETALGKVVKSTDGAPVLPLGEQTILLGAIELAGDAAREIIHADKALMSRLTLAVDPTAAKALLAKLDPVERLFRDLEGLKVESEPDGIHEKIKLGTYSGGIDPEKLRELIPFKEASPVYAKIRQWLNDRKSKDKEALRKRLLDHTKLKDDFIDRLPAAESRIIYRLIYRGTEAPGPEDKVHEAAEKKDGVAMVLALRELAGADPQRLKALEKDSVFRASASAMNQQVKMPDGQLVRPWHVCMVMWGLEPGATQDTDPNTAKLSEYDPTGDKNPLTIDERMKLEGELLEACIKELNAEITGKNMRQEYTYLGDQKMKRTYRIGHVGDPQAVSNILVTYDRKAAQPDFVKLLQREHMVFGREIERRYQERFSVDLRTWIYENAGPVNRSGANRVLGSEQGASVGMFNGKMLMAGEMDQKGKMTLAQALREHTWEDRPIYEWASVSSRAIAHNLGDKNKLLEEWDRFALAVGKKAPEITTATGINVRAIDLLRNAYMEHSGHFQTHLQNKYKDKQPELTEIKGRLGLTDTVDVPADAKPPTVAEEAERNFSKQAKELWDGISGLNQYSPEPSYTAVGVLMNYRRLPTIPVDPKDPAVAAPLAGQDGYTVEERPPRSFNAYYRLNYGTSPELHAAALLRTIPDPRMVTAEKGAQLLGIDPKKVTGDWATPEEKASIGAHNRHLVRASFTMDVAAAKAKQIWEILTGNARLDLIQTLLAEHNDEEQALIRAEFRALSGGFDLTFYIRQMMAAREAEKARINGQSKELSAANVVSAVSMVPNGDAMALMSNQWAYRVNIGTGLADKGNEVAGLNQYTGIQSRSTQAELEQMLSIASTGNMDPRARLRGACERDSQHEIKLIVDELTVAERKQVLADGTLMNMIYDHLEQFDEERVYKILTGQGDLADRLYSRSHGGSWSERKIWGGTDEDGMRQDIRLYVRQMRLKHNADVRGEVSRMVQAGNAAPRQDQIDKEVDRRVGEACLKLASNESVRAIMKSELTTEEFAEMESMIKNGTADARDWAVAGGAGKADILSDVKAMSLEQRKERLADPNYMRLLGTRLREEKDYREVLTALQEGIGGGGSGLGKLDEVSRSASQAEGSKPDGQKTLDALTCLSQTEFTALKNNPALQAQVMSAMNAEQQAIAREYLAGPDASMKMAIETAGKSKDPSGQEQLGRGAGSKGGTLAEDTLVDRGPPQTVGPDGKPLSADEAAKQAEAQLAAQKEAYVRFIVHQSIHRLGGQLRSKTSWSLVLEAAVEIYKADLPAISADKGAKLDKTAPRQLIWAAVAPHMTVFSAFHDNPDNAGQMTLQPITGSEMRGFVQAAVLGQADPSDQLIESKIQTKKEQDADEERLRKTDPKAATKKYGIPIIQQVEGQPFKPMPKDDVAREEDIKDAIGSASDDKVIKNWTTYIERPPGGTTDHTMKARYDTYRAAFDLAQPAIKQRVEARKPKQKPVDVSPKSPPPTPSNAGSNPDAAIDAAGDKAKADQPAPTTELGPLGDKDPAVARMEEARGRFLEFRATESVVFEAMLRQFMGDDRTLTKDGTYDPNKAKISITKNKRYNNLVEALLQRALHLRPETIAAQLGIHKDDVWLLRSDMRGEVGQMALSQQKNLRYSGAQRSVGGTALEEKQQLDVTTFLLYKTFADATSDYKISGEEKENLAYRRDQNDRARDSYKTALETAAMWASLITSVLVTLVATILTGGLALGPIGMMAIGGVTMLISAHAQAAVNKEILQDEFDSKDKRDLITKEVMTGLVTMGTTFFAQGLLSTLGKGARLFQQTTLMKQVFQKPPSIWGVFLREASEEVLSEGMDNVVEAHLEATNPEHFVDGMKIGAKRARAAADAILARAPDQMYSAALTSLITAGVGKLKKGKGKPEFDAPKDARKRTVNIRKNLKMVFGDPEEKFTAAGIEWLMQQRENGKIDWDNAPEELLKGLLQEYKESVHEVHGQYAHHGMQSRKVDRHIAAHGHYLQNSTEVAIFTEINKNAGTTDPFVSAKDFARIRTDVAVAGLQAFEQQNGPLTNAQREAFVKYVREAQDTDTLHARAKENPLSVRDVKYADADAKANTAVGKSMASDQTAFKVLRDLADGKTDSLKLIGVEVPPGFDPTKNEWGLGRRVDVATGEVSYILIKGEDGAVNWEGFPGVEPIAHSHPDKGPNGRNSNHLKKVDGDGGVDVVKLCNTEGADRIHFLPSGADMVFVLAHRINQHTVLTPFQSLGGGRIGNPTPGSNGAGINVVMKNPKLAGYLFGNKTSPVAEVEFEIWAGNERLHTVTMWGSDHLGGSHLWSSKPTDLMGPVDLGADGNQAGGAPGPRRTPTGQRDHDDNGPPPTHPDPNHPANRRTQQMQIPTVTPQQDPNAPHNRQTQRQMPAVDPNVVNDPNAAHNRQTQVGPAVVPGQQQVAPQQSEYDQATDVWKNDKTSAADLKGQIDSEEWETALGHIKEARLDPEIGPTIAHIPDHELVALFLYTDYHYRRWNLALRDNDHDALQKYAARIKAADSALAAMPSHEGWVERGTGILDDEVLAKYQPGQVVTEQAFTSASAGQGNQGGFTGGATVFRIKSKTGKRIDKLAKRGENETEVLFRPGTRFVVTERSQQDHTTIITMEEIDSETDTTRSGSNGGSPGGAAPTTGSDPTLGGYRTAENGPRVNQRNQARLGNMSDGDRTRYALIVEQAQNEGQRKLLERALAAGRSLDELHILRMAMNDMSEQEVLRDFSGAGIIQFYQHSCVPTSYQIAIADVDPFYALQLRNNPSMMMQQQRDPLVAFGGAQYPRQDLRGGRLGPGPARDQVSDPLARRALEENGNYSPASDALTPGIEATQMHGTPLHQQLQAATGVEYDVITSDHQRYDRQGQGQFPQNQIPHDRIKAAADAHLPVIFSMMGHTSVIVGIERDPGGDPDRDMYLVSDPADGRISRYPTKVLDAAGVANLTLPRLGEQSPQGGGRGPHGPGGGDGATRTGARSVAPIAERVQGLLLQLSTADESRRAELEQQIRHLLPATFSRDWLHANKDKLSSDELSRLLGVLNTGSRAASDRRGQERHQRDDDDWSRSKHQEDALVAAKAGETSKQQRDLLVRDINRQVPDVALSTAVQGGKVHSIISLVVPGGGPTGIKTLNDELIGSQLTDEHIMPQRNALIERAFRKQGITVVEQNFKQTTLVSPYSAAETQAKIQEALQEIDRGMKPILQHALLVGLREWEAKGGAQARVDKIKNLLIDLSGGKYVFDAQVGTTDFTAGKTASYEQILAAKMNANKAALMGREGRKKGGGRTTVYTEESFLAYAKETADLLTMLEGRSITVDGQLLQVVVGDSINRDVLRDLRKGKIDAKNLPGEQKQTLALLQSYFDHVNSLDYIKHARGDELAQTQVEIEKAQGLIDRLKRNQPQPGDAEAIEATLQGQRSQAGTASEAQFFNKSAKGGQRVIVSADMKDLGLEVFDDYAVAMAQIHADRGANLDRTSASADNRVLDRKRGAVQEFLRVYQTEILPKAVEKAMAQMKFELADQLGAEKSPPVLLGGDEITISLHPAIEDLGLMPAVMTLLSNPSTINARVAVARGTDAKGQRDAMKEGRDAHDNLKEFEKAGRRLQSVLAALPNDKRAEAEGYIRIIGGLYISVEDTTKGRGEVFRDRSDGRKIDAEAMQTAIDVLLKAGGFDPKKGGGGGDGQVHVAGMGQTPKTYPWRENEGGVVRTADQAIEIARSNGVLIPADIAFLAVNARWLPANTYAEYMSRSFTSGDALVHWDELYNRFEMIAVKFSREILSSDEAIVAIMAHEMHELNNLREEFNKRGGAISAAKLRNLIHPGIAGNLHDQAWDVADAAVEKMRKPKPPGGPT